MQTLEGLEQRAGVVKRVAGFTVVSRQQPLAVLRAARTGMNPDRRDRDDSRYQELSPAEPAPPKVRA